MKAPELHVRIPARKPCVTDVLCSWEINSLKKHIKNKTRKQNVLGFWGEFCLCVFLPHKE